SGRTTSLDNDTLRAQVGANPCQTIAELPNTLKQPWSTIQEHLNQIGKESRAGVWRHHTEAFFDSLITGDEKWVLYDNPKRKRQQLSPNKSPRSIAKPG
ncbi:histone-lysine N-methyltransferase SETMAR-like, partial [Augochlora pura]